MDSVSSVKPDTYYEQSNSEGRSPGYIFGTLVTAILGQCSPNSFNTSGDDSIQSVGSPLELLAGGLQSARGAGKAASGLLDNSIERLVDTNRIRFTQDSAGKVVDGVTSFSNDAPIQSMISALRSGALRPEQVRAIRIFVRDGKYLLSIIDGCLQRIRLE